MIKAIEASFHCLVEPVTLIPWPIRQERSSGVFYGTDGSAGVTVILSQLKRLKSM
nr:hypothetical protein [Rhizobium cellulosilyticum]